MSSELRTSLCRSAEDMITEFSHKAGHAILDSETLHRALEETRNLQANLQRIYEELSIHEGVA